MKKSDTDLIITFIVRGFGVLAITFMFNPAWYFWLFILLAIMNDKMSQVFIGILCLAWKFKFLYWLFPRLFHWILAVWPHQ